MRFNGFDQGAGGLSLRDRDLYQRYIAVESVVLRQWIQPLFLFAQLEIKRF